MPIFRVEHLIDPDDIPPLCSVAFLSTLFDESPKTTRNRYHQGLGPQPAIKIGGRLKWSRKTVLDYLQACIAPKGDA